MRILRARPELVTILLMVMVVAVAMRLRPAPGPAGAQGDRKAMVFVPAGPFLMGSDGSDENESPVHQVVVEAFFIDRTLVTNAEFERFTLETGYVTTGEASGKGWIWGGGEWVERPGADWRHPEGPQSDLGGRQDHPVVQVSFHDAQAYARWARKRLPTEAEWEKAARGTDARTWPWGNRWDPARLNSGERGPGTTMSVLSHPEGASPYGALDMAGNVWEWVDSWYRPYPGTKKQDEDYGKSYRVLRGGSWDSFGHNARCANRTRNKPVAVVNCNGFRTARTATDEEVRRHKAP